MRKSYKPNIKKKNATPNINIESIKESEYVNLIIKNNIKDDFKISFLSLKKILPLSEPNIMHIIRKMNYISISKSNFRQLKKESYLNIFLLLALYKLEYKIKINRIKDLLLRNYILFLNKIYSNKKISINDISLLLKFLTFCSVYKRKEINNDNKSLLKNLSKSKIKYYEIIAFIIDIIKYFNIPTITIEFCEFLDEHFLSEKYNLYYLTEKPELLELLYLNDNNDFILNFISKIYSFRINKSFLNIFIEKIKTIYKERRDKNITKENEVEMNNSFSNLLYNLNRSVMFSQKIKQNEENKSKKDTYFPEKGFIFNNNKTNGLFIEKIIVQNALTIVFSFCLSPELINTNIKNNDIEYPIIFACSEKDQRDYFYFYIKNNCLFYNHSKESKNYNICNIKINQTYLCYYSIKEHDNLVLSIKSDDFEFEVWDVYKDFLRKNLSMRIGRYDKKNFEGYIGPILIFKEFFENEYKNYIFSFKGYYDKILYFHEYNTSEADKFDKYMNNILSDGNFTNYLEIKEENKKIIEKKEKKEKDKKDKKSKKNVIIEANTEIKLNNQEYYLKIKKIFKENDILNKSIICYISPLFSNSSIKKSYFINNIFVETTIKKFVTDSKNESSTIFYRNKNFIFQFLKYEGINYFIMALELIMANYDIIKIELYQKEIINIFQYILIFIIGLLTYIDIESFYNDIRKFLFCIKKFCIKFSKINSIGNEIHLLLNNTLQKIDSLNNNNYTENKRYYINTIKNEICKILLNYELYDLNNFSLINKFMQNLFYFIENQNHSNLLNLTLFKKLIDFAIIYDKINIENNEIKHNSEFKTFRNYFSAIIINFVKKSGSLEIYKELYNIFSNDLKFNYLKYQSIKLFYLVSENYFNTVDENTLFNSWKYFIDLFEYLQKNDNNIGSNHKSDNEINEKEMNIIMSICIRIIFENLKYKEFFRLKIKKNEVQIESIGNLLLKTKEEDIKNNINRSLIFKLINSGYWTETKNYYMKKDNKANNDEANANNINDKKKKKRTRSKSFSNEKIDIFYNNLGLENVNYGIKRINSLWLKKDRDNFNFCSTNNLLNYIGTQNNINIDNMNDNDPNEKMKKNKYSDFSSYRALISNLSKCGKLNDYCFKALLLYILENNNNVIIPQSIRLNFILKVKKYEDLQNPNYKSFLCIRKYTKEITKEFRVFIKILELNKNRLSSICYDILLYILIQIIKDKEQPRSICSLFMESKKICHKLYKLAFLYNKETANLFIEEFPLFIKLALPYHRKIFFAYLLYESILDSYLHNNYSGKLLNILLNTKIELDKNNIKSYYDFLINKIFLLYHVFKADKVYLDEKIDLDENGILSLVDDNLIYLKYDILYSAKKKCYIELLFDFCLNLVIKSNFNKKYSLIMNKIFVEETEKIKKKVKGSKTIIFYIDKNTIKDDKKNPCLKFYNKNKIENSLCINLLLKALKIWLKFKNENKEVNSFLQNIILNLFEDSKLIYKENKIFQKKDKNNFWYNFLLDNINEIVNKKRNIQIEEIQNKIEKTEFDMKNKGEKNKNIHSLSATESSTFNLSVSVTNISDLDFAYGNNSLSDNEDNENNEKKENAIEVQKTSNNKIKEEKNKNPNINDTQKMNNINNDIILSPSEVLMVIRQKIYENKTQYTIIKDNSGNNKFKYIDDNLDIENNIFEYKVVLFPKNIFLDQRFAIFFTDILFYNKLFILMKNYYKYYIKKITNTYADINNFFNYPTIIRNYTPQNIFYGEFFLKKDLNFFDNDLMKISHPYFMDILLKYKIKDITIFPRKNEKDDIYNLIIEKKINENNIFYIDLVTNRDAVFGQLIISQNVIYFENLSKEEFLKNKTDSAKEKWLLCSLDCDYSNRRKRIYIFKNEIRQIINRRFLYLFQACELFLKNGKSYYFNFYSEEKKIQFFSIFNNEKDKNKIDIIYDIKSSFKKSNYTKLWLSNELSTLEYLLLLNKFSSRSYNDINQYPVFPWLEIYNNQVRDLKYTIAAQTEDDRMMKKEMYLATTDKFPYHYTTHYSNSAFLSYYLVRINPFTYNQINLQVNKFDNPMRQFNAIDEILRILNQTSQPREVIPEFFLSTEFFYNYNCNFFGITDNGELINNLYNKEGFNSPLDYILHNLILIETPQVKNEINYFFDNIYGVGQMGGIDAYNTYDKYSYQEMLDLREKIKKYRHQKLNYLTIKDKIMSKCNKIISFGQTPFKLLEDKHPQWIQKIQKKEINEIPLNPLENTGDRPSLNNLRQTTTLYFNDEDGNIKGIKISSNIIYFDIFQNFYKDSLKLCIIMLNKITKLKYELRFYDTKFNQYYSLKHLSIPKEIKFFSKLKIFNSKFLHSYKYSPKNIMIQFKLSIFILCHFNDNSFKIFNSKGENFSVLTESMVTCLYKINENTFMTGHINGRIIVWEISKLIYEKDSFLNDFNKINYKNTFIAHKKRVNNIICNITLGIIISSGDDRKIYIRKFYDLTLFTMIEIPNQICIDMKVEHYYLYVLLFDEIQQKHIVKIYSLNGIEVGKSEYDYINNFNFDKDGNLLIGYFKKNYIDIYDPSLTYKICEIHLIVNEQSKILSYDKKNIKLNENIPIGEDVLFMNFCYDKFNNSVYCSLSNGFLFCKNLNNN